MVFSVCFSLGLSSDRSRSLDFLRNGGNCVGIRRFTDALGLSRASTFSRLTSCSGTAWGPWLHGMASFVRPPKSVRPPRPAAVSGQTESRSRGAMRKHRMGGSAAVSGGGASCRGSTLLLGLLISLLLAFLILFGFTFRGAELPVHQELDASTTDGGFKNVRRGSVLEKMEDDRRGAKEDETEPEDSGLRIYGYEIVGEFDHDPHAFTQGLLYAGNGTLYESTGLYGQSTVRKVDLLTGKVRRTQRMNRREFGEGLALWKDRLYQVAWRNQKIFIYDEKTLAPRGEASHQMKDGWGLTTSDEYIIGSDGSSKLYFMKPETFEEVKVLTVRDGDKEVGWLNELEFVHGEIWANIWQGECIARISPENGKVTGWILLQGLRSSLVYRGAQHLDVLNGIAWDQGKDKLYVTGKLWPKVFEIKLSERSEKGSLDSVRTLCNIGQEGFM